MTPGTNKGSGGGWVAGREQRSGGLLSVDVSQGSLAAVSSGSWGRQFSAWCCSGEEGHVLRRRVCYICLHQTLRKFL